MSRPDLSVAIIFKNEIRCLERCLKSLQPLRERFSLQIVMADTGSTDGSRAVAERYADVLFDFPWINDFAAARNAVLDRCRGKWTLVMDCDEWLEADMDELAMVIGDKHQEQVNAVALMVWNYVDPGFTEHRDVPLVRLLRMGAKPRYEGMIHEHPAFDNGVNGKYTFINRTILHHDGYVMLNDGSEAGAAKRARNLALVYEELRKAPDDLRRHMELLDVAEVEPDISEMIRRAIELIEAHKPQWDIFGPPIMVRAVQIAFRKNMPEFDAWARQAWELFPASYYMRIDVAHFMMTAAYQCDHYKDAARMGEEYLSALRDLRSEPTLMPELTAAPLQWNGASAERDARIILADAYRQIGQYERAAEILSDMVWDKFDVARVYNVLNVIVRLYVASELDLSAQILGLWKSICALQTDNGESRAMFLNVGSTFFGEEIGGVRPGWEVFLPLRGKCILGDAAALLAAETPEEADLILAGANDPTQLPPAAFIHALKLGAEFPIPDKTLTTDQIAACAEKMLIDPPFLREAAKFAASAAQTEQEVLWAYALAKVALEQATASLKASEKKE